MSILLNGWKFYAVGLVRRMWRSEPGFFEHEYIVTADEMQQEGCNEKHDYVVRVTKVLRTDTKTAERLPGKEYNLAGMAGYVGSEKA